MPNEKKNDEEHGVRLSYKFRIYPTPSQCEAIKANIDASRFVYNHYLRVRMDAYERTQQELRRSKPACDEQGNVQCDHDGKEIWERTEGGKVVFHTVPNPTYDPAAKAMSMFDTSKDLTRLKKELVDEDGKPWLKEADATALIYALRNLDTAYQNFFRGIKKGQDVIMGISCTKHPGEDAWGPTITAARLLEKAEKALLRDADAYFAQRAAQEALSLLKANEQQIEQLHTLLEQEGSEDGR